MLGMRSRQIGTATDADEVLDELLADPAPSKKSAAAKAARKRRVASPAELAKSPRPRHALPNVVALAERPAMLQRIDEVRRSLAAGGEALLSTGGALCCADEATAGCCLPHMHARLTAFTPQL